MNGCMQRQMSQSVASAIVSLRMYRVVTIVLMVLFGVSPLLPAQQAGGVANDTSEAYRQWS
jgi:hypothetical protein